MLSGEPLSPFALEKFIQYMEQETNPQERVELLASTLGQALWLPQGVCCLFIYLFIYLLTCIGDLAFEWT
jgi:hypothetical protein